MRIGVVFPHSEIGTDPSVIRDYAQTAEGLGYSHILAYDHVLGASTRNRPGWTGYTSETPFHEPFVLFSYMAGVTQRIGFATGVLVLPQRQTALVAKQAAEVDVLSGGRLRLGVGVGWNAVEFEALNENFNNRGKRIEEQIELLRKLFTEPVVDFHGQWHRIAEAGINPLPVQRPIPIWIGGTADAVLRRVALIGAGWIAIVRPEDASERIELLRSYAAEAGRDPASIGIEAPRLTVSSADPGSWRRAVDTWEQLGADYITIYTLDAGLDSPRAHIAMIERVARELGLG